jgi:hypothetical protein
MSNRTSSDLGISKLPTSANTPRDPSPSKMADPNAPDSTAVGTLEDAARNFKPTMTFYLAMTTLALLTFIVSIDATALAVALPVRLFSTTH